MGFSLKLLRCRIRYGTSRILWVRSAIFCACASRGSDKAAEKRVGRCEKKSFGLHQRGRSSCTGGRAPPHFSSMHAYSHTRSTQLRTHWIYFLLRMGEFAPSLYLLLLPLCALTIIYLRGPQYPQHPPAF